MVKKLSFLCLLLVGFTTGAFGSLPEGRDFPYPSVPDSLRTVEGRMDWLALHYWDKFDFQDSLWISSPDMVEQGFVNYVDLLPKLKGTVLQTSVRNFIEKAYRRPDSRLYFSDEAEHYLFSLNSLQRNDSLYITFLKETFASGLLPEDEQFRYRFQLENVRKNLPGTKATDFVYEDKGNTRRKMTDFKAKYLILFFYNPDCGRCRDAEQRLAKEPVLRNPSVKVLAIYPGSQTREWLNQPLHLPFGWADGCSPAGEINNRLLYFIQSTPSIYLLDENKNVILKDVSPQKLVDYLNGLNL